jgi:hypothetical protein
MVTSHDVVTTAALSATSSGCLRRSGESASTTTDTMARPDHCTEMVGPVPANSACTRESRPVGAVAATQCASDSASAFWKIANVVMKWARDDAAEKMYAATTTATTDRPLPEKARYRPSAAAVAGTPIAAENSNRRKSDARRGVRA